jgi:hypothetical protein
LRSCGTSSAAPGSGGYLAQRAPEPERAVADREHGGAHPAAGGVAQQIRPGLGRLAVAVGQGDELLAPIGAHADEHQQAQLVLLEADVDVDAVGPQVDVVHARQAPAGERLLLALPGLGQLRDHRRGQAGRAAEELPERGYEVPGRQAVQVEQRQHLGDLRGLAAPGRQDRRGEPAAFARLRVGAAVVDPRRDHLDRAGRGQHLAGLVDAVAHHQPAPVLIAFVVELGDVGVDLGLQRFGQHPTGALADDLVDQRHPIGAAGVIGVGGSGNYGEHRSYPSDRRWRADLA